MKLLLIASMLLTIQLQAQDLPKRIKFENPVKVLNFGTFHMGYTPDATTTEFDEHDRKNIDTVQTIAKAIATFQPTVILVEKEPRYNKRLLQAYNAYLKNPDKEFKNPGEIQLLAYEVGRLARTKRIYGIDYQEHYNYRIAEFVNNPKSLKTYEAYNSMIDSLQSKYPKEKMSLNEKLRMSNNNVYKDILINGNADMLTHVSTPGNAEGADEAAKFYHRNLVMYSNLNQIELDENDRVFILMGASHTAFFDMFMERSPKYELVDALDFLK